MKYLQLLLMVTVLTNLADLAGAAPVKVQLAEFSVTGAANRDEIKGILQTLLTSRLSGDEVMVMEGSADVAAQVSGSYIASGQTFSIDAVVKGASGELLGRRFVQGNSADELIPAVGRLAEQLRTVLPKVSSASVVPSAASSLPPPVPQVQTALLAKPTVAAGISAAGVVWQSPRLTGELQGLSLIDGGKLAVVTNRNQVVVYRNDREFAQVSRFNLDDQDTIVSCAAADLDTDGQDEMYLSVFRNDRMASRVLQMANDKLVQVAGSLPWHLRGVVGADGRKKINAQAIGQEDYAGPVLELVKKGAVFTATSGVPLPRLGTIYNSARLTGGPEGALTIVLHPSGYLLVYNTAGEELWRSSETYGGSSVYFERDDYQDVRLMGTTRRKVFSEQKITVTADGLILVPRNEGTVIGTSRNYNKHSFHAFRWNGLNLEEKWQTRTDQTALADYSYDPVRKELTTLQVLQGEGFFSKGASAIVVKKVE